ncbi:MAG: peptide deformylase [Anaerofustis sp.]
MAIRNIRVEGDEILKKKSRTVDAIDDRIKMILDDMAETMYAANGLGLAAVQVGVLRRLVTIDVGNGLVKLINPVIIAKEGEEVKREGCLSVPELHGMVKRPISVTVKALNEDGEELTIDATGLYKKALCHELDHLEGVLFTDIAEQVFSASEPFEDEDDDLDFEDEENEEL